MNTLIIFISFIDVNIETLFDRRNSFQLNYRDMKEDKSTYQLYTILALLKNLSF